MPPSSQPVKEQILDDVITTLQGINGGATYFFDIVDANIKRLDVAPPMVSTYPSIFVGPAGTEYDNPRSEVVRTVAGSLRLQISCYLRTATDVAGEVERLIHDVHTALYVDITRSGLAINTRLVRDEVFYPTEATEPICGADIFVDIDYRALRTDLTTVQT